MKGEQSYFEKFKIVEIFLSQLADGSNIDWVTMS